jgi:ubiquitin-activating enzyme E1
MHIIGVWNKEDAEKFIELCHHIGKRYEIKSEELKIDSYETKFFYLFSFSCQGVLNPLCAYLGGFTAQECIKAITQKFSPI